MSAISPHQTDAHQRDTHHQQPAADSPADEEGDGPGTDQLAEQNSDHRQRGQDASRGTRPGQARLHACGEPLALDDVALGGPHEDRYRQPCSAASCQHTASRFHCAGTDDTSATARNPAATSAPSRALAATARSESPTGPSHSAAATPNAVTG